MCDLLECVNCQHKCKDNITDKEIEKLWNEFEDVPMELGEDYREYLVVDWQGWSKGTWKEDIWFWFDQHHSKGVGWLTNEYEE